MKWGPTYTKTDIQEKQQSITFLYINSSKDTFHKSEHKRPMKI